MQMESMIKTHPNKGGQASSALANCIQACFDCAAACTACADACLAEEMVAELRYCINTDLDCADICQATGRVLSRQTQPDWTLIKAQLEACITAVRRCASECEQHAGKHEHCKLCAEACRTCEKSCSAMLASAPS